MLSLLHHAKLPIYVLSPLEYSSRSAHRVQLYTGLLGSAEVLIEYNLTLDYFDSNGYVYFEIRKGMYWLIEAYIMVHEQLPALGTVLLCAFQTHTWHVAPHRSPNYIQYSSWWLWYKILQQRWCKPSFSALQDKYSITINWSGDSYLGLTINWNYDNGYVGISMTHYVPKPLANFKHPKPCLPQHALHGQCLYMEKQLNSQPLIRPLFLMNMQQQVQAISGTFYTMHMLLIPLYCHHSRKFPTSKPDQQRIQWKHSDNLWTIYTCILRLLYILMLVIWFFPRSQILPAWCRLMRGVAVPRYTLSLTFLRPSLPSSKHMVLFNLFWASGKQYHQLIQPCISHERVCWSAHTLCTADHYFMWSHIMGDFRSKNIANLIN